MDNYQFKPPEAMLVKREPSNFERLQEYNKIIRNALDTLQATERPTDCCTSIGYLISDNEARTALKDSIRIAAREIKSLGQPLPMFELNNPYKHETLSDQLAQRQRLVDVVEDGKMADIYASIATQLTDNQE